jgi:hypothetical protein
LEPGLIKGKTVDIDSRLENIEQLLIKILSTLDKNQYVPTVTKPPKINPLDVYGKCEVCGYPLTSGHRCPFTVRRQNIWGGLD